MVEWCWQTTLSMGLCAMWSIICDAKGVADSHVHIPSYPVRLTCFGKIEKKTTTTPH